MSPVLGILVALVTLLADQGLKYWLVFVYGIEAKQPVSLAPVLDIVLARNRGISYSLFAAEGEAGRLALLAVTLAVTGVLGIWLLRMRDTLGAVALGLIIGGALGNAYDRWTFGAVTDFVWFHVGRFSWYIFNGADVAITCGVALLLAQSLFGAGPRPANKSP